jgi:hypothetical protein
LLSQDHGRRAADSESPALGAGQFGYLIKRGIMFAKNVACASQKLFARFRQDHVTWRTHKHLRPNLSLQLPDLHANRRLGHVYSQSSGSKRARFSDRDEGA